MDAHTIHRTARTLFIENGLSGWTFGFNTNKSTVGICRHNERRIEISQTFLGVLTDAQIMNTLTHEIAHAIAGYGHGHDAVWRATHRRLGGDGKTRAEAVHQPDNTYKWVVKCPVTQKELGRVNRKGKRLAQSSCRCHLQPLLWVQLR